MNKMTKIVNMAVLLLAVCAFVGTSLKLEGFKLSNTRSLQVAGQYPAQLCMYGSITCTYIRRNCNLRINRKLNGARSLYCESQAVEVIPPEKDEDNMKIILNIPPQRIIKRYILEDFPKAVKDSVIGVLSDDRVKDVRKTFISCLLKLKNLVSGNGFTDKADADFSSKALAGLGLNALLAYGFVSNVSYITCLVLSWISFSGNTQMSPLAPGQWKPFLAIYAGYWAVNNVLRPLRFSLSLLLMPYFNKMIDFVQRKQVIDARLQLGS